MKATKKLIFYISTFGLIIYLSLVFFRDALYDYCFAGGHCWQFWNSLDTIGALLLLFPTLFLLSLITYKMRDEVFRAWWNFARWWVPVIILATYLQSTQSGGAGPLGMHDDFDRLILGFFYAVLVIVSLWRIVRKYRQLKREIK